MKRSTSACSELARIVYWRGYEHWGLVVPDQRAKLSKISQLIFH